MDNFIVSARKYRPSTFNMVVGQSHITNTLKNAIINNQLAQAFLFTGPRGVGKTTCARILAKTINCTNLGSDMEPCNQCESCLSFNKNASFNIHELDAASNNSVDDIRNLVNQVRIPPQIGKYKVHIIDEVHMLSSQAFNAFLKTLEEPPAYAKFILATTEKHKIIPTILSRCQIYDFKRIGVQDIAEYLKFVAKSENINAEPEGLQIIAQKADGALRDALSIFDQLVSFTGSDLKYKHVVENLNVLDYDYYFDITSHLYEGNLFDALLILDKILESGFDGQHFLSGLGAHFRDLLVCQDSRTISLLEVGDRIKTRYQEQATATDAAFLLKALNIIQKIDFAYRSSNNKRLHLEITLMQIVSINDEGIKPAHIQPADSSDIKKKTTDEKPSLVKPPAASPTFSPPAASSTFAEPPAPAVTIPQKKAEPPKVVNTKTEPVRTTSKAFLPGSVSISDEESEEEEQDDSPEVFDADSDEFKNMAEISPSAIEAAWKNLLQEMPDDQPDLKSTLAAQMPVLTDGFVLELEVKNAIQQGKVEAYRPEIIPYMRQKLNNRFITLKAIVNAEQPADSKPVSPLERFSHLAAKNPAMIDLQKKFGLEPNY